MVQLLPEGLWLQRARTCVNRTLNILKSTSCSDLALLAVFSPRATARILAALDFPAGAGGGCEPGLLAVFFLGTTVSSLYISS